MSAPNEQFTGQMDWPCVCRHPKGDHYFGDGLDAKGQPHTSCQRSDGCHRFTPADRPVADREPLTPEEEALLRESCDPQYQRLPMPERDLVRRLLATEAPESHGDASVTYRQGWEAGHKAGLSDAATEARSGVDDVGELREVAKQAVSRLVTKAADDHAWGGKKHTAGRADLCRDPLCLEASSLRTRLAACGAALRAAQPEDDGLDRSGVDDVGEGLDEGRLLAALHHLEQPEAAEAIAAHLRPGALAAEYAAFRALATTQPERRDGA